MTTRKLIALMLGILVLSSFAMARPRPVEYLPFSGEPGDFGMMEPHPYVYALSADEHIIDSEFPLYSGHPSVWRPNPQPIQRMDPDGKHIVPFDDDQIRFTPDKHGIEVYQRNH